MIYGFSATIEFYSRMVFIIGLGMCWQSTWWERIVMERAICNCDVWFAVFILRSLTAVVFQYGYVRQKKTLFWKYGSVVVKLVSKQLPLEKHQIKKMVDWMEIVSLKNDLILSSCVNFHFWVVAYREWRKQQKSWWNRCKLVHLKC